MLLLLEMTTCRATNAFECQLAFWVLLFFIGVSLRLLALLLAYNLDLLVSSGFLFVIRFVPSFFNIFSLLSLFPSGVIETDL